MAFVSRGLVTSSPKQVMIGRSPEVTSPKSSGSAESTLSRARRPATFSSGTLLKKRSETFFSKTR